MNRLGYRYDIANNKVQAVLMVGLVPVAAVFEETSAAPYIPYRGSIFMPVPTRQPSIR
jgi:hypothetical protein